jgi:hypothetical protein
MKKLVAGVFTGFVLLAACVAGVPAQSETVRTAAGDKYLISAKAGGISYVEGGVVMTDKAGQMTRLVNGNFVETGERLETVADGRAEIMLNPGSYLRLGPNSAFKFESTSLDDLRINLSKGSAVFEVFAGDEFQVTVTTPASDFTLVRSGVYRVDVDSKASSTLSVWKGVAKAGGSTSEIKAGRAVTVSNGVESTAKFDRDEGDVLDTWSKARARETAKATAKLEKTAMRTSLMRSFLGGRWNVYESFGLWVFNPLSGGYCFLPFGYGWASPYGFGYGNWIGYYNLPPAVYTPPVGLPVNDPSSTYSRHRRPGDAAGEDVPPFVRVQGATSRHTTEDFSDYSGSRRGSSIAMPAPVMPEAPSPSATNGSRKP